MPDEANVETWLGRFDSWRAENPAASFDAFARDRLNGLSPTLVARLRQAADRLADFDRRAGGADPPAELRAGREPVLGYRLQARLGRGAFGEVWRAIGPGGIECALKFVPAGGLDAASETRALAAIRDRRHPHLIAIFGVWATPDWLVVAMELADGSLADEFRRAAADGLPGIPPRRLQRYVTEAAAGLDHLAGPSGTPVQHRDVKPQNLLVVGDSVKVADYGLARFVDRSAVSHTGAMTVEYAPPEFFEGQTTPHSDQYSLAVTYCFLRGGRLPFSGSRAAVMRGHLLQPPDLGMLPPAEHGPVARALAKDPAGRWESCQQFARALSAAAGGEPAPVSGHAAPTARAHATVRAEPHPGREFEFAEGPRRGPGRRGPTWAVVGLVAGLIAGTVGGGLFWVTRTPRGELVLTDVEPGTTVLVDARPYRAVDGTLRLTLEAGSHRIEVARAGHHPLSESVAIVEGNATTQSAKLQPVPVRAPLRPVDPLTTAEAKPAPPRTTDPVVPPPPGPPLKDPAAETAKSMLELGDKLADTRWTWPDTGVSRPWFLLRADRTVVPAWHKEFGTWEVASPTTIRAVIMSTPRTPQTFLVDWEAGTLKNVRSGEVHRRLR